MSGRTSSPSKPSLENYAEWHLENINENLHPGAKTQYEFNIRAAKTEIESDHFIQEINSKLKDWDDQYFSDKKCHMLSYKPTIDINIKNFDSVLSKIYRYNISQNKSFPNPPSQGWLNLDNLYERINDLFRCQIICRYVDCYEFLIEKIQELADTVGYEANHYGQARETGYYAHHVYVKIPAQINSSNGIRSVTIQFEIQITTQLQFILYDITHIYYNKNRNDVNMASNDWKWDFKSSQFRAGYISHSLHLLEAIIAEIRDNVFQEEEN